jgi:hypothetical protein
MKYCAYEVFHVETAQTVEQTENNTLEEETSLYSPEI